MDYKRKYNFKGGQSGNESRNFWIAIGLGLLLAIIIIFFL